MSDSDKSLAKSGKGLDIRDIIVKGLKVPGVLIERSQFLRTELSRYPKEVIEKAVSASPAQAGISPAEIDSIADEIIQAENWKVSGASFVLGFPGGWSMAATIPADLIQYYAWTLRIIQKLLYLYGFPEIDFDEDGEARLDSATVNKIVLCFGVMYGVHGANQGIKVLADGLAKALRKSWSEWR